MKKVLLGFAALATICLTQSCVQDVAQIEESPATSDFESLKVSPSFDWVTSENITCTVNTNVPTNVEIYTDEACKEELLAAFTTQQGSNQLALSIAQGTDKLYLKYATASDASKVLTAVINNSTAAFSVTDGTQVQKAAIKGAITRAEDVPVEDHLGYIAYPAGWGTVMFEDLYPGIGDYDFNDFVASYQISVESPWRGNGYDMKYARLVRVHLKLKAIGGSQQFTPYVRIKGLNKSNVSMPEYPYGISDGRINPQILNNTTDGVEVSLVDNSTETDDAIVEFKNLNASNPYAVKGVSFYNTTQGKTTKENQLTQVNVYLLLNKEMEVKDLLDDKIDIFIASPDRKKEIHLRGFDPVFAKYDYSVKGVSKDVTYTSDKNLVWGLKIAKIISHVVEKENFCNVYQDFAGWAQSDGISNTNWYQTNVDRENLIKWAK